MLLRLNEGEDVVIYSRESNERLVVMARGDIIMTRSFQKNDGEDIDE